MSLKGFAIPAPHVSVGSREFNIGSFRADIECAGKFSSTYRLLKLSGCKIRTIDERELDTQKLVETGAGAFCCWESTNRSAIPYTCPGGTVRSEQEENRIAMAAVAAALRLDDIALR